MRSRIKFAWLLPVCLLGFGCNNQAPPAPLVQEVKPEELTGQAKEMYEASKEISQKGAENLPDEVLRKSAGVAGPKLEQMQKRAAESGGN